MASNLHKKEEMNNKSEDNINNQNISQEPTPITPKFIKPEVKDEPIETFSIFNPNTYKEAIVLPDKNDFIVETLEL